MSPIEHMGAIPCLTLAHGRDDIGEESLASVMTCDPRLLVDVVHNPAFEETGDFLRSTLEKIREGTVRSLTAFDENISNNAVLLYLLANRERYAGDYVILTDGDILAPKGLVDEQINILEKHPEVFACGLRMDATRWDDSLPPKKDALRRFNTDQFETEDYVNSATGLWMTMFRGQELLAIVDAMMENAIRFTDGNLKMFGSLLFQKNWVATKRSIGRELNRERVDYYDRKAVSTSHFGDRSPEPAGSNYATWNHDLVSQATVYLGTSEHRETFSSLPTATPRFRGALGQDPVLKRIAEGTLRRPSAYVVKSALRVTKPGLGIVLSDGRSQSGIWSLPGDRSAVFLSPEADPGPPVCNLETVDAGLALITRPFESSLPVIGNLIRFLGDGGSIKGLMFNAEKARRTLASGSRLPAGYVPVPYRQMAIDLAIASSTGDGAEIEAFLKLLFTDENLRQFAKDNGYGFAVGNSEEGDYVSAFTLNMPANSRSIRNDELVSS